MDSLFSRPLNNLSGVACGVVGTTAAAIVIAMLLKRSKFDAFPTVGPSSSLGSWWAAFRSPTSAADVLQEGYLKHKLAPFKILYMHHWTVVLSHQKHVDELVRAPKEVLSLTEAVNNRFSLTHTLGVEFSENSIEVIVVRSQLTRNIGAIYPEIRNEMATAFEEVLDLKGNEWKSVRALGDIQKIVCRTSNRVFIGLPLCRDPDWIDLNIQFVILLMKEGYLIGLFPEFLRPLAACLFKGVARSVKRAMKHLGGIIDERLKCMNEYGNEWAEKPNDMLAWLMDEAKDSQWTIESLVNNLLTINFASIHMTSATLFYLAANPQYIQPLREEVKSIVEREGWSRAALNKMYKVDSFLRESLRMEGITLFLERKAMKDFTFSDGTFIPKGMFVGVPVQSLHHDERFYETATAFEPFRFVDTSEGGDGARHQFISTATDYLAFGHGKYACPGRFFAAVELKSMLAHVVMMYDIKLEDDMTHPCNLHLGHAIIPDFRVNILFRKRID